MVRVYDYICVRACIMHISSDISLFSLRVGYIIQSSLVVNNERANAGGSESIDFTDQISFKMYGLEMRLSKLGVNVIVLKFR